MSLADWHDVALNDRRVIIAFDGDIARKESVQKAAHALAAYLAIKGARVEYLHLPDTDDKTGLDDYLMAGHTAEDLWKLVKPHQPPVRELPRITSTPTRRGTPRPNRSQPISPWTGRTPSSTAGSARTTTPTRCDAVLATAAVEKLDDGSDPVWLLVICGPGNAKTETVQALDGVGADRHQLRSPATPRCCRRPRGGSAPRTPPAGCCAASATAACWSSRTSRPSCR